MNRKNKIQKMHDKRLKRARANMKNANKEKYVSKADRAKEENKEESNIQDSE